ncbi:hypothetical protein R5W23_002205 [Gemmata sp. JC673]|uniref:Secreted protein n=1 Tax=Gemmata algarum TaxID=2975278 RepID=A0ABU5F0N0_9BACT|nr:hypothetical protein [Gemmata algarum]MDY3560956.1 hypothetical protein [Gemmata algarum]
MRRSLFALICGLAVAPLGCGDTPAAPKVDKALEDLQNKSQKQADAEERQMQKQNQSQNKGQNQADSEERQMQKQNRR